MPEEQNQPARVVLIEVPSRVQLCVKNLVNVADCKMHWQKSGDHLCVKVDRYKSKKEEQGKIKYLVSDSRQIKGVVYLTNQALSVLVTVIQEV
jgi:uncharacterized protein with WD repeat